MPLKDVHVLVPRTYKYVTLHGGRNLTDRFDFEDSEVGSLAWNIQVGLM